MMKCPHCTSQLHWNSDFDYEDYGREGSGVIGSYSCSNISCIVEDVDIFMNG